MRAVVEHHAADELHVVVPHVEHAPAGLADHGKCLGQQVVERLAVGDSRSRNSAVLPRELGRRDSALTLASKPLTAVDERAQTLQLAIVLGANNLGEDLTKHAGIKADGAYSTIIHVGPWAACRTHELDVRRSAERVSSPLRRGLSRNWSGLRMRPLTRTS